MSQTLVTVGLVLALAARVEAQRVNVGQFTGLPASDAWARVTAWESGSAPGLPRYVPRPVRTGMIVGGIVGGSVAAVWWFTRDCEEGWGCILGPALAPLPIGLGAAAGILVGGTVGRVIAGPSPERREPVFLDVASQPRFTIGLARRF